MKTISNERLKFDPALLAALEQGETFAVTEKNRLVAFLVPAYPPTAKRPSGLAKREFAVPADFNDPSPEIEADFYGS
jgi:antitoxin (DNA-binding transcriptional repressor) of toxin-antitoxin stability system